MVVGYLGIIAINILFNYRFSECFIAELDLRLVISGIP